MFKREFYAIPPHPPPPPPPQKKNIHEPVARVLRDCRTTVGSSWLVRRSCKCRDPIAAKFGQICDTFATLVRVS